jgi:hypothetical protein
MTFIYRYHCSAAPGERHHDTLDAAIEDAAGALVRGDAFPREILSDTGDVIVGQRDLLRRIGFSERWISSFMGSRNSKGPRAPRGAGKAGHLAPAAGRESPPAP